MLCYLKKRIRHMINMKCQALLSQKDVTKSAVILSYSQKGISIPLHHWSVRLSGKLGAQWLSDRVLDSRPKGRGFEPHPVTALWSLSKTHFILA